MGAFGDSITHIKDDTKKQEGLLQPSLSSSYEATFGELWVAPTHFKGQPIDQSTSWSEDLLMDLEKCEGLYLEPDGVLPNIAKILGAARDDVESMTNSLMWYRDDALGNGPKGCWEDWDTLRVRLRDFLDDLQWQTDKASQILQDVVKAFEDYDRDAAADLTNLSNQLNHGSGHLLARDPRYWLDHVHPKGGIGGY